MNRIQRKRRMNKGPVFFYSCSSFARLLSDSEARYTTKVSEGSENEANYILSHLLPSGFIKRIKKYKFHHSGAMTKMKMFQTENRYTTCYRHFSTLLSLLPFRLKWENEI